ncbi:hypothetical protein B0H15DRAFT_808699 [Mycena belliarum]|uniref:Uncharacterized protein n=1 Tax=Mycena belliarum TaxID=1033014 RepID=A0AAD6UJ18_9AGAR|nr:hypothetical protein B0H15DRAFT_808699 [Mycena belliae]
MLSKLQIVLFALAVLSVPETVLGRPAGSPERPNRVVVRVVAKPSASTCSSCAAIRTVTVSGSLTATPASTAVTVYAGYATRSASPSAASSGSTPSSPTSAAPSATADTGRAAAGSASSPSAIGNFGSCSVPEIEFGTGFDGQPQFAFQPVNRTSYNFGPNPSIGGLCASICDAVAGPCGADATAQATCDRAHTAAGAAPPGQGVGADIFNAFFGITTNFAAVPVVDSQAPPSATRAPVLVTATLGRVQTTIAATSTDAAVTESETTPPSTSSPSQPTTSTASPPPSNTGSAGNLQVFTGKLGGVAAPQVVVSGSKFRVDGSNALFNAKADALTRACDTQQNTCSDAANASGNKNGFTVGACNEQKTACKAANGT